MNGIRLGTALVGVAGTIGALAYASRGAALGSAAAEPAAGAPAIASSALAAPAAGPNDEAAREAFRSVYTVFMHARCMNCHPVGDSPLQGDDSHMHTMNVTRGVDGKGKYALKCTNCHQDANLPGENMPPGNPTWHLPPANMKMVFEGKTAGELCRQLKDPKLNGGKTLEDLIKHVSEDKLVLWGWDPGDGRTKPPLDHATFAKKFREWVENGAACPE